MATKKTGRQKPKCKAAPAKKSGSKPRGSLKDRLLKGLGMLLDPGEEGQALRQSIVELAAAVKAGKDPIEEMSRQGFARERGRKTKGK